MSLLFGAVVRSIGNITRDFPFNWIVFASVSYKLRASHSPIILKIRTRNFSLAATGIITETRPLFYRQGRNSLPCSLSRHTMSQCMWANLASGVLNLCKGVLLWRTILDCWQRMQVLTNFATSFRIPFHTNR